MDSPPGRKLTKPSVILSSPSFPMFSSVRFSNMPRRENKREWLVYFSSLSLSLVQIGSEEQVREEF